MHLIRQMSCDNLHTWDGYVGAAAAPVQPTQTGGGVAAVDSPETPEGQGRLHLGPRL